MTKQPSNKSLIEDKPERTVHPNIIRPLRTKTEGGAKYILSIIQYFYQVEKI